MKKNIFLERVKKIHGDIYEYLNLPAEFLAPDIITIRCLICGNIFSLSSQNHLYHKKGCSHVSKRQKYINLVNNIYNLKEKIYDYSLIPELKTIAEESFKISIKCLKCYKIFSTTPFNHLYKNVGCPNCEFEERKLKFIQQAENKYKDEDGNPWFDYSFINYKNSITKFDIKCKKCGSLFSASPINHLKNHSYCNCYRNYIIKKRNEKNLENRKRKIIEKVTKLNPDYNYNLDNWDGSGVGKLNLKIYCPKCKNWFIQSYSNHFHQKQRCPCEINSKGEEEIVKVLKFYDFKYEKEKTFKDCLNFKTFCPLSFDFYLPDYNLCIEYDGKQHFEFFEFFGNLKAFEEAQERDKIKNIYCKEKKIELIRIPYWEFKNIEKILLARLKEGKYF